VSDAIDRKGAAAIFGVSLDAFDQHVRPHLVERRFGRHPRFSRAECEELWCRGGPVAAAPKGKARPAYVTAPVVATRAAHSGDLADLAARLPLTARQRRALLDGREPSKRGGTKPSGDA
jgi:hypothetical protein